MRDKGTLIMKDKTTVESAQSGDKWDLSCGWRRIPENRGDAIKGE